MTEFARLTGTTLRIERTLPGPIERVWAYIVEPEKRALWFTGGTFDLRVGGEARTEWDHTKLSHEETPEAWKSFDGQTSIGTITRYEPPRLLSIRGEMGEITYELTPVGNDVLLAITQTSVDAKTAGSFGSGWHAYIDILDDRLNGRKPRGFWTNFDRLQQEYAARF